MKKIFFLLMGALALIMVGCSSNNIKTENALSGNTVSADQKLSKEEVNKLFSGKTVKYTVVARSLNVVAYFDQSGEARELRGGESTKHPWWVKDNGAHCIQFKGKKPSCKKVVKKPDGTYVKYSKGKLLVRYNSFVEGNPNNL